MINSSSPVPLIVAIAAAWLFGFLLVAIVRRNADMHHRLRDVPGLMYWQAGIAIGIFIFALSPAPLRWLLLLVAGARMTYEAVCIHRGRWSAGRAAAVLVTPVIPLLLMAMALNTKQAATTLVVAFFLSEVFDSFAYLGGKAIGKRRLAPGLSPNKTWEGLLTGTTAALLASLGLVALSIVDLDGAVIFCGATLIFATFGDMMASVGKRLAGVKDYPTLISSQGGLLDMFDSWIYVAPMAAFALQLAG